MQTDQKKALMASLQVNPFEGPSQPDEFHAPITSSKATVHANGLDSLPEEILLQIFTIMVEDDCPLVLNVAVDKDDPELYDQKKGHRIVWEAGWIPDLRRVCRYFSAILTPFIGERSLPQIIIGLRESPEDTSFRDCGNNSTVLDVSFLCPSFVAPSARSLVLMDMGTTLRMAKMSKIDVSAFLMLERLDCGVFDLARMLAYQLGELTRMSAAEVDERVVEIITKVIQFTPQPTSQLRSFGARQYGLGDLETFFNVIRQHPDQCHVYLLLAQGIINRICMVSRSRVSGLSDNTRLMVALCDLERDTNVSLYSRRYRTSTDSALQLVSLEMLPSGIRHHELDQRAIRAEMASLNWKFRPFF